MTGIFVCKKCHVEAYKKNSRYLLRIWTFSGYSSIFNVVVIGTMAAGVSNHLIQSMHYSMERGMRHYLDDMQWKKIIDTLQFNMQCCGFASYKDWHTISWMSATHVINSSEIIHHTFPLSGQHLYLPAVPWSCCKLDYYRQCFHDPIQQYQYVDDWARLTAESVNHVGCMELLRQPIELSFLLFVLATYLLFFLQIALTIVSRYIYTSYKSAVILGDPFGVAPGWILDKSDFGYGNGPGVYDIMHDTRATSSGASTMDDEESDNDSGEFHTPPHYNNDGYRVSREQLLMR
ncbi:Tetraspanin 33B [Carabus blaptoides fortunei]